MGVWGFLVFENDTACDWANGLTDAEDLSLVESALNVVDEVCMATWTRKGPCGRRCGRMGGPPFVKQKSGTARPSTLFVS